MPPIVMNMKVGHICLNASDYESWDWMIDVNIRGHLNVISKLNS